MEGWLKIIFLILFFVFAGIKYKTEFTLFLSQMNIQTTLTMESLIYANRVFPNRTAFIDKVKIIGEKTNIDPNSIMGVIYLENPAFDPSVHNPYTQATGLFQFMPATALKLGTTIEALSVMSNVEQLDFVEAYLMPYRNKINSFTDLYFAIFFPAAIGKPDDYILKSSTLSASIVAQQNWPYDLNNDLQLTVLEVKTVIWSKIDTNYLDLLKKKELIL